MIKRISTKELALLAAFVVLSSALFINSINASSLEGSSYKEDEQVTNEAGSVGGNVKSNKFIVMPSSLTRFLFYNIKPNERQNALGSKRSSSSLDTLTGVTFGKRSFGGSAPVDYVNWEPLFNRQYGINSMPRMYDMRWAPLDAYEASVSSSVSGAGVAD